MLVQLHSNACQAAGQTLAKNEPKPIPKTPGRKKGLKHGTYAHCEPPPPAKVIEEKPGWMFSEPTVAESVDELGIMWRCVHVSFIQ